ncbi:phage tail assembly chaperone [Ciceribacter sp. L1K23]|uniref:rcc01693 family protein n=1 Tax=Ciceribacter sp. L1K23 TaxID=2820276 RepID=UPI001B840954|nr:rcc01693 family protein [Ciceribacter sp. L1K23]MBR0556351.1 phage tail assembly chaperone [Ciceribacter sp. L1K23]
MTAADGAEISPRQPLPWDAVLHAGLFLLRLPPELFWRLSLPEFAAMTGGFGGTERMARGRLGELMRQFPDGVS